jgi:hypothetical protein
LPLVRPSNSHPLCSTLTAPATTTTTTTTTTSTIANGKSNAVDLKSRRRVSLSSASNYSSFVQQPHRCSSTIIDSTIPALCQAKRVVTHSQSISCHQPATNEFISTDRTAAAATTTTTTTGALIRSNKSLNRSSSINNEAERFLPADYRKGFMHKIERFRFIDDSASSTTTVTSPVESLEHMHSGQTCGHLITSAIEQFDDYMSINCHHTTNNNIDSLIDRLDSDTLINGSYSDLNILNHGSLTCAHPPQPFKSVNDRSFQSARVSSSLNDIQRTLVCLHCIFFFLFFFSAPQVSSYLSTASLSSNIG